jgi:hypothetical protein
MTRRTTTTHSIDAHDSTKDLLKSGAEHASGRHRGGHAPAEQEAHLMPGPAPVHRARKPRPTMPKM